MIALAKKFRELEGTVLLESGITARYSFDAELNRIDAESDHWQGLEVNNMTENSEFRKALIKLQNKLRSSNNTGKTYCEVDISECKNLIVHIDNNKMELCVEQKDGTKRSLEFN